MTDSNDNDNPFSRSYKVGYGRPPVASRFKKGKSGNPMGRPKRPATSRQNLHPDIRDQIIETAERQFQSGNGQKSGLRIVADSELRSAVKGDSRAQKNYLDRVTLAYAERDADIRENHAFWRNYTKQYQILHEAGHPLPEECPHPDDLVFEEGKYVCFIGGEPAIAAKNRAFAVAFRDIMILKAGLDYRAIDRDQRDKPLQSEVLVRVFNDALPARYRLDDIILNIRLNRARQTRKRELEKQIREGCCALDLPDVTRIPAGTITKEDVERQRGAQLG